VKVSRLHSVIGYLSHITLNGSDNASAADKCAQEKREVINGEDILFALMSLGFENYAMALKIYLARYRQQYWKDVIPRIE